MEPPGASARSIATRFRGLIFVGDSTLREVAWATLMLLAGRGRELRLQHGEARSGDGSGAEFARSPTDAALGRAHNGSCLSKLLGKTGWTAFCPLDMSRACEVTTAFANRSDERRLIKAWLTDSSKWDGQLRAVDARAACATEVQRGEATFLSYQGTFHNGAAIDPSSIPSCVGAVHPVREVQGVRGARVMGGIGGGRLPLLLVANGSPLHQLATCSPWRHDLPAHVLGRFARGTTKENLGLRLLWQPAAVHSPPPMNSTGSLRSTLSTAPLVLTLVLPTLYISACQGGWLPQPRPPGCTEPMSADAVAAASKRSLDRTGLAAYYDHTTLATALAPLMSDGNHFSYFHAPCQNVASHVPHAAAQLLLRTVAGDGQKVRFCSASATLP